MAKLKLVWENNPDTPLSAANLSKLMNYSTDDNKRILYVDDPAAYPNGDGQLKIRANSKISFVEPKTNAFFRFDDSLVSHNSKYIPSSTRALTYRIESLYSNSKSVSFDESSQNISDDNNWNSEEIGDSTAVFYIGDIPSSTAKFATLTVDISGNKVEIYQEISYTSGNTVSISFYYKGSGLRVIIEGDINSSIKYWYDVGITRQWQISSYGFVLPTSTEWTRFQTSDIDTSTLNDGEIKVRIFNETDEEESFVGALQFEELNYCSSYIEDQSSRDASQMIFESDIIDPYNGLIDLTFRVDSFGNDNILLIAKTASDDALKLYFDVANEKLVFEVYDTLEPDVIKVDVSLTLDDLLNEFIRVIVCWDSGSGIKITTYFNSLTNIDVANIPFVPFTIDEISEIQVGGEYNGTSSSNLLRGMIDSLKFGFEFKSSQQITEDLSEDPKPELNDYKFFEVGSENITLNSSYLDFDTSFDPSTKYFVWICDDKNEDSASILISRSDFEPDGYKRYFSRMLGSFTTNVSSEPEGFNTWDVSTYFSDIIHTNRFVVGGIESSLPDIEFRRTPFGESNDATFNVPTHYTDHIFAGSFMDIDPIGIFNFDNVRIDGSEITSINLNSDLTLTANGSGSVIIDAAGVQLNSTSESIRLENVLIDDNEIRASSTRDLLIRNDGAISNVIIEAISGAVVINAASIDLNAGSGSITFDQVRIEQDTISNPTDDLIITSIDDVMIQSGAGEIHIDDLKIKDNLLFNDIGDVDIEAIGFNVNITGNTINFNAAPGGLGLENLRVEQNKLYSQNGFNLVLETENSNNDININSPGPGSVYINTVKFDSNKIYSDSGIDLIIHSETSSDVIFTGERILFETALTIDDENIRFKDSSSAFTNAQGHSTGSGLNIYPESASSSSNTVFTVSNNGLAKQFEVLEGDGVRIGESGLLKFNETSFVSGDNAILGYKGYFYANKVYNAIYNDLAECWPKDPSAEIDYGQVVVRNHALGVELSTKRAQKNVVGVVSKDFGYLLGAEGYNENLTESLKVPIAISGRVKVKVYSKDINRLKYGDELVSYKNGVAAKANWFEKIFKRASIIGKFDTSISSDVYIKI